MQAQDTTLAFKIPQCVTVANFKDNESFIFLLIGFISA